MVAPRVRKAPTIQIPQNHFMGLLGALAVSWLLVLYLYLSNDSPPSSSEVNNSAVRGLQKAPPTQPPIGLAEGAPPVFGTREKITVGDRKTEITYALPETGANSVKATALLLHACSQHARKFFSQSATCETCDGLSEELRISRILLDQKSIAVLAVTSHDRSTGCWSDSDYDHVRDALEYFKKQHPNMEGPVLALGTSSGGVFGVQLAVRGIVDASLVTAMHLRDAVAQRWLELDKKPPVYFAPMPKDADKLEKIEANFQLMNYGKGAVLLDKETCQSRPLDASYLNERVPKLSLASAQAIITDLTEAGHIDWVTGFLVKDPTVTDSGWREILQNNCGAHQGCLENQSLEHGESPLAKSLNRAWAFHDYCSDVTVKALTFFEKELGGAPFLSHA